MSLLVQVKKYDIYLPLRYNDGSQIEDERFDQVDDVLYERFGGLTTIQFFGEYKEILKSQFQQEEILITVQEIGIF